MGRLSLQSFVTHTDGVCAYLTRPLHIQLTRPHMHAWFAAFPLNAISLKELHLEDTDHPIARSLQGLAIGAVTLFFVILLLSLTASLQEQVNNHIAQPQLDPWATPFDEQC